MQIPPADVSVSARLQKLPVSVDGPIENRSLERRRFAVFEASGMPQMLLTLPCRSLKVDEIGLFCSANECKRTTLILPGGISGKYLKE